MNAYRIIKISDRNECECCGKTNLKRTVHMENMTTGQEVFYGVDCASRTMRQNYMGKSYPVSRDAVLSMAARAKTDKVTLFSKA